jgi:hypothetical protein
MKEPEDEIELVGVVRRASDFQLVPYYWISAAKLKKIQKVDAFQLVTDNWLWVVSRIHGFYVISNKLEVSNTSYITDNVYDYLSSLPVFWHNNYLKTGNLSKEKELWHKAPTALIACLPPDIRKEVDQQLVLWEI